MNPLHFKKYTFRTQLSSSEVIGRLADNIEPMQNFRTSVFSRNSDKPYEGSISGNSFKLKRLVNFRNKVLPVIKGNISTLPGQTRIDFKMRPGIIILIFLSLCLGIVGLTYLDMLLVKISGLTPPFGIQFSPMILIPFGMFIFYCLIALVLFKKECRMSKEF